MTVHPPPVTISQTLWFSRALLPDGWANSVTIGIQNGRIAAIADNIVPDTSMERHALALPGLVNLHSHGFQRGMAGLAERRGANDDTFWTWREIMYRFLDQLTPEDVEIITAFAFADMLEGGFTHVAEFHYLHHDCQGKPYADSAELAHRVVAAAQQTGIGLTLLPVLYAHSDFGAVAPHHGQRRFISTISQYEKLLYAAEQSVRTLVNGCSGIAPHSLRAVSPDLLRDALQLARHKPVHIHAAEQIHEVEQCLAWSGERPVEWLFNHCDITPNWCFIHATHVVSEEVRKMAASGAVAGLCPITEANLGDGIFPTAEYQTLGGRYGIGTDSNVLVSAAQELRQLEYAQRLDKRQRNVLASQPETSTARRLFEAALAGGAQAAGITENGLRPGNHADIVSLSLDDSVFVARDNDALLDSWIFSHRGQAIDCVWRAGRKLVSDGVHTSKQVIGERYKHCMQRILS